MSTLIPAHLGEFLARLDTFIEAELKPLEAAGDNQRFFDHRREYARTDWDREGLPHADWEALLAQARVVRLAHHVLRVSAHDSGAAR